MALFYGGLAQFLAGMWEFAAGNTFGATGEYWVNVSIIHSRLAIQGWRVSWPPDVNVAHAICSVESHIGLLRSTSFWLTVATPRKPKLFRPRTARLFIAAAC